MASRPVEEVLFETLQDISLETSPEVWADILEELRNGAEIYRSIRLSRSADVFLALAVAFATTIVLIGFAHWFFIVLMFLFLAGCGKSRIRSGFPSRLLKNT